jgi:23S rRNA (adenine2503-C2)-methyltransferase
VIDLKGMTPAAIDRYCVRELDQRPGQGLRAAAFIFRSRIEDIAAMTDLNRRFREQLSAGCRISRLTVERSERSDDGSTKLLYRLEDGKSVEGVLIPGPGRLTLCVSTQVGCASACGFCLTGTGGFTRNLTPAEIVNQVFAAAQHAGGSTVSNIVLMGTGEPLSNYDAVRAFIETATDHHGLGLSPRRVTISTCGIAPMIERLADDGVPASLAVSLNATTDAVRDRIMPVNRSWPIARLMQSLRYYCENSGKTVAVEYVLFKGVNDSNEDARRLVDLTDDLPCMVNLLTFNPFAGSAFERPDNERLSAFRDILVRASRITVVRKSRGRDIGAACGQLRAATPSAGPGTG